MSKFTWDENPDAEIWYNATFETVEECFEDARLCGYNQNQIAIGEVQEFEVSIDKYETDDLLEKLQQMAYEECGTVAEDWEFSDNSVEILSKRLTECVRDWLEETKQKPNFYSVTNIKVYDFPNENKE